MNVQEGMIKLKIVDAVQTARDNAALAGIDEISLLERRDFTGTVFLVNVAILLALGSRLDGGPALCRSQVSAGKGTHGLMQIGYSQSRPRLRGRSNRVRAFLLVLALTLAAQVSVSQDLPPEVQAKILNIKIVEAFKSGRSSDVLSGIDEYTKLESAGVSVPPAILFLEAEIAGQTADRARAYEALGKYLRVAPPTDPNYEVAVRQYAELDSDPALKQQVSQRREAARTLDVAHSSSSAGESCRRDSGVISRTESLLENCEPGDVGICVGARTRAACYGRAAATIGCASVADQFRDLQRQYEAQAAAACQ